MCVSVSLCTCEAWATDIKQIEKNVPIRLIRWQFHEQLTDSVAFFSVLRRWEMHCFKSTKHHQREMSRRKSVKGWQSEIQMDFDGNHNIFVQFMALSLSNGTKYCWKRLETLTRREMYEIIVNSLFAWQRDAQIERCQTTFHSQLKQIISSGILLPTKK